MQQIMVLRRIIKNIIYQSSPSKNIWKFLSDLDKIILDYEIEYQRFEQGLQITRKSSKKNIENAERRKASKDKLQAETLSTTQYLNAIS